MHNSTQGLRMRAARRRAGLSLEDVGVKVAQAIGRPRPFSPQNVQQWEVGKKVKGKPTIEVQPSNDALLAFAKLVGLPDTTWLVTGVETERRDDRESAPTQGRVVAIISASAAAQRPINYKSDQHAHTQVNCSKTSFAFTVFDRRNQPEFQVGDRIVIDPEIQPEPGMMVFAVADGHPVFARYTEPRRGRGHWTCKLMAADRAWGTVEASSRSGDRIVGVMVEHTKIGPHPRSAS